MHETFVFPCQNSSWEALVAIFGIYAKNAAQRWGREPLKRPVGLFPGDLFLWLCMFLALAFLFFYYLIGPSDYCSARVEYLFIFNWPVTIIGLLRLRLAETSCFAVEELSVDGLFS